MIECVQGNEYVHERVVMYKEMNMYIGGLGLTPWGRPMINKEIQGETWFGLSSNLIDHGKKVCKFIERFLKRFWKWFLKSEGYSQEVLKEIRFENLERKHFWKVLKKLKTSHF